MGTEEKWIGRESGKERRCGGGEREVERKGMWDMGERECKIKGYVGRKGIWDRKFGNAIWGERGYGKRGEERELGK